MKKTKTLAHHIKIMIKLSVTALKVTLDGKILGSQ